MTWFQFGLILSGAIVGGFAVFLLMRALKKTASKKPPNSAVNGLAAVRAEFDKRMNLEKKRIEDRLQALERSHLQLKANHERREEERKRIAEELSASSFEQLVKRLGKKSGQN